MRSLALLLFLWSSTASAASKPDWVVVGAGAGAAAVAIPVSLALANATAGRSSNLAGGLLPSVGFTTLLPPAAVVSTMAWTSAKRGGHLRKPGAAYAAGVGISLLTFGGAVALRFDSHQLGDDLAFTAASAALLPIVPALLSRDGGSVALLPLLSPASTPGATVHGGALYARF